MVVYIYKPRFLLGLCLSYQVFLLFGHIWKVKQLTTILVALHGTLVCCALIGDSLVLFPRCVYLLVCGCWQHGTVI